MADTLETYRTVTPYLVVKDADAEIKFLQEAFGAKESVCERTPSGAVMHAEIHIGDSLIMIGQASEQWKALGAALYVWIPNVDKVYATALAAGATSVSAPEDKPYGHRNAGVLDLNRASDALERDPTGAGARPHVAVDVGGRGVPGAALHLDVARGTLDPDATRAGARIHRADVPELHPAAPITDLERDLGGDLDRHVHPAVAVIEHPAAVVGVHLDDVAAPLDHELHVLEVALAARVGRPGCPHRSRRRVSRHGEPPGAVRDADAGRTRCIRRPGSGRGVVALGEERGGSEKRRCRGER